MTVHLSVEDIDRLSKSLENNNTRTNRTNIYHELYSRTGLAQFDTQADIAGLGNHGLGLVAKLANAVTAGYDLKKISQEGLWVA